MDLGEQKEACVTREADWHNLVNPTEPPVCGSDAALCQITFTTCSFLLLALYMYLMHLLVKQRHFNSIHVSNSNTLVNRFITVKLIARRRVYCIIEACNEGRYGVPVVAVMDFYCGRY